MDCVDGMKLIEVNFFWKNVQNSFTQKCAMCFSKHGKLHKQTKNTLKKQT